MLKNQVQSSPSADDLRSMIAGKLLGKLEAEIMQCMWDCKEGTVQQVVDTIGNRRRLAYTTVMTVMGHLVDKGLLKRTSEGKRYLYRVAQSQDEFVRAASQNMVRQTLRDFGDLAIAGFMGEISKANPEKLEELRSLLREALDDEGSSK